MKLAETKHDNTKTGCCAEVDPTVWDGRTLTWTGHPFLKDRVRSFFHVPLNFGAVARRTHAAAEAAAAYPEHPFWLSDETSPWGSDFYLALDRDVSEAETTELSGTFMTKVFEGSFREAGGWARAMREYVEGEGRELLKLYFFYATCPRCAKRFGRNRVVLFAQVD